jgi:hypothetical protein
MGRQRLARLALQRIERLERMVDARQHGVQGLLGYARVAAKRQQLGLVALQLLQQVALDVGA